MMVGNAEVGMMASGAEAWDISGFTYSSKSVSVASQTTNARGVSFSADGTKMYVVAFNGSIFQYTLSVAWDVSTASYASKSYDPSAQVNSFFTAAFSADGTKMYCGYNSTGRDWYQYTLSTPWDVSTASYASKTFSFSSQDTAPKGLIWSSDGSKAYMIGDTNNTVFQFTAGTAWDISTLSYASKSFSVTSQGTNPSGGIFFKSDGTKMYYTDPGNKNIYQYTLSTPWDVSTASYDNTYLSTNSQNTDSPHGVAFSSDGKNCYVTGKNTTATVYQYSMS